MSDEPPLKEFVGLLWIGDQPAIRVRIEARTVEEAKIALEAEYGAGHSLSLWNEADARKPRGSPSAPRAPGAGAPGV